MSALPTNEHDRLRLLLDTINAQVDLMVRTYDSRVLAAALLQSASSLYCGLRQHNLLDAGQVHRAFELALDICLDDSAEAPRLVTKEAPGAKYF